MEAITRVVKDIEDRCTKIGLYMVDSQIATSDQETVDALAGGGAPDVDKDFRKKLADGEAHWIIQSTFSIGSVAFSDRVQNPEKEAEDTDFAIMIPDEVELMMERIRNEGLKAFEPDGWEDDEDLIG